MQHDCDEWWLVVACHIWQKIDVHTQQKLLLMMVDSTTALHQTTSVAHALAKSGLLSIQFTVLLSTFLLDRRIVGPLVANVGRPLGTATATCDGCYYTHHVIGGLLVPLWHMWDDHLGRPQPLVKAATTHTMHSDALFMHSLLVLVAAVVVVMACYQPVGG
jgi:hypothetical protein